MSAACDSVLAVYSEIFQRLSRWQNRYCADADWGVLDGVHVGDTWRIPFNRPCAAATRPDVKLIWPVVRVSQHVRRPQVGRGNVFIAVCFFVCLQNNSKSWVDFHEIRGTGRLWTREELIKLSFQSDSLWIKVSRKCRHTATAGLRVERNHCWRLRLYWYNGHTPTHLLLGDNVTVPSSMLWHGANRWSCDSKTEHQAHL